MSLAQMKFAIKAEVIGREAFLSCHLQEDLKIVLEIGVHYHGAR